MRALALLLALLAAAPQQPQIPSIGETIEVSIVNVDVFVTDAAGNRVHGLTRNDFEIYEDRKPQPITNFAEYTKETRATFGVEAAPVATAPSADSQRRVILVFVDRFRAPSFKVEPVFAGLRDMLHKVVRPGDRVLVASWSGRMHIRQEPTGDLAAIDNVLTNIAKESVGVTPHPLTDTVLTYASAAEFEKQVYGSAGSGPKFAIPSAELSQPFGPLAAAREVLMELRAKTDALESLITAASGLEGKKILLMSTRSYGTYAGVEFFGGMVPPRNRQELETTELRKRLTRTANANGVTIYPIYPLGLGTTFGMSAEISGGDHIATISQRGSADATSAFDNMILMNETTSLYDIARETGGAMAWGERDIVKLLPRIADDFDSCYSLGYRATSSRSDRVRSIRVVAKNRAYTVRSRKAVVEKSPASRMKDRVVATLFQEPEGRDAIPFTVEYGKPSKLGSKWLVPLTVRVPIEALTTVPDAGGNGGGFSVFVAAGGDFGVVSDVSQKTQPFNIPQGDVERARESYFTYDMDLETDGRADHIAVGVFDELSKEFGLQRLALPPAVTK